MMKHWLFEWHIERRWKVGIYAFLIFIAGMFFGCFIQYETLGNMRVMLPGWGG